MNKTCGDDMKFALMVGSLRKDSLNRKLLSVIETIVKNKKLGDIVLVDAKDIDLPLYNQDIEDKGMPEKVQTLTQKIISADALIISSPEYNGSISSPLKNSIDWISRHRPIPFKKLPILMTGASPGGLGAMRGIAHAKTTFDALNAIMYPDTFTLPKANKAFNSSNELIDNDQFERLENLISDFQIFCAKLKK